MFIPFNKLKPQRRQHVTIGGADQTLGSFLSPFKAPGYAVRNATCGENQWISRPGRCPRRQLLQPVAAVATGPG